MAEAVSALSVIPPPKYSSTCLSECSKNEATGDEKSNEYPSSSVLLPSVVSSDVSSLVAASADIDRMVN